MPLLKVFSDRGNAAPSKVHKTFVNLLTKKSHVHCPLSTIGNPPPPKKKVLTVLIGVMLMMISNVPWIVYVSGAITEVKFVK